MGTWSLSSGPGAVRESHAPGSLPELALLEKLLRAPYLVEMKVVGSREGAQRGERGPRRSTAAGTAGTCWEPWDRAKEEGRLPPLFPRDVLGDCLFIRVSGLSGGKSCTEFGEQESGALAPGARVPGRSAGACTRSPREPKSWGSFSHDGGVYYRIETGGRKAVRLGAWAQ